MVIYSWFTHWKWWFSIVMLVYQRLKNTVPTMLSSMIFKRFMAASKSSCSTGIWVDLTVGYGDDPGSFHLVKRCQKSRMNRQNSLGLGVYRVCTVVTNAVGNFTPILSGLLHPFHLSVSFPLVHKQYSQQGGRPPVMFVALQNPWTIVM